MDNSTEPLDFSLLPDVSDVHPDPDTEDPEVVASTAHLEARANALHYIFGKSHPEESVWTLQTDHDLFWAWPGGAIMCFPPQGDRTNWYYVTHGLAQPLMEGFVIPAALEDYLDWRFVNFREPVSGWGIELVMSTREFCKWPFDLLFDVVEYLILNEDSQIILPGHRLPVGHPIGPATNPLLTHFLAITSPEYPSSILLPGGPCSLVHLVGVTEAEIALARRLKNPGSLVLQSVLQKLGVGCLTEPERSCLTTHPQFKQAWKEAEDEVKNSK